MNARDPMITSVRQILEHPNGFQWSLQGFGMLRCYLKEDRSIRMHVWSGAHAVEDVSEIHDHPWDFESKIVVGKLANHRYLLGDGDPYMMQAIKCGEGGGLDGEPTEIWLKQLPREVYLAGDSYSQMKHEIHRSMPEPGTVSLIRRTFGPDTEHAHVFWPRDKQWVSAEPRPATPVEVRAITQLALARWFK